MFGLGFVGVCCLTCVRYLVLGFEFCCWYLMRLAVISLILANLGVFGVAAIFGFSCSTLFGLSILRILGWFCKCVECRFTLGVSA